MAHAFGNERHLALDTNVLVQFLVSEAPEHERLDFLQGFSQVICPTVIHEAYHTCVFKLDLNPRQTAAALKEYMDESLVCPIDAETGRNALDIAVEHHLGGRDALVVLCYANAKRFFPILGSDLTVLSFDYDLLQLKRLKFPHTEIVFSKPLSDDQSRSNTH